MNSPMSLTLYRALHIQSHSEQATSAKNVTGTESLLRMWSGVSRDCTVSSGSDVSSSYFSHVEAKHEVAAAYHCNLQAFAAKYPRLLVRIHFVVYQDCMAVAK